MEQFLKPIKGPDVPTAKSTELRAHPYKSKQDLLKEKCCAPRPMGNVFTSSSTGHQVSQGKGGRSTSYFASRNLKLARQFKQPTIVPLSTSGSVTLESSPSGSTPGVLADSTVQPSPQIFRNCSVYINGYMGPLVSDIELKKRLAQHGARVVTNFGRKSVTHVILGPNGLAGGKIQKEMLAKKMGVKYVTVDWYLHPLRFVVSRTKADGRALDSLREGKRCVEARYAIIRHEVLELKRRLLIVETM